MILEKTITAPSRKKHFNSSSPVARGRTWSGFLAARCAMVGPSLGLPIEQARQSRARSGVPAAADPAVGGRAQDARGEPAARRLPRSLGGVEGEAQTYPN